jgi:hypothetical protein
VHLSAERWRFSVGSDTDLAATLIIEDVEVYHRLEKVLVIIGRKGCALVRLDQCAFSTAFAARANFEGIRYSSVGSSASSFSHFDRSSICSNAAFSMGGSSLPRRSALRKIPSQAFALK